MARTVVRHRHRYPVLGRVVRHVLLTVVHLGDAVGVRSGLVVRDRLEAHRAVRRVLCGLQHLAVGILQLEGELPFLQVLAAQHLGGPQLHLSRGRRVTVAKRHRIRSLAALAVGNLRLQRVRLRILRHRHRRGKDRRVVGDAVRRRPCPLGHGVDVRPHLVQLQRREAERAVGAVLHRLHHVTVGVLQVEEELTLGQVAAGQSLRSGNRRRRCRRRVGVGEGQIRSRLVRRRGQLAAAVIGHVHRYVQHRIAVSDGAILARNLLHLVRMRTSCGVRDGLEGKRFTHVRGPVDLLPGGHVNQRECELAIGGRPRGGRVGILKHLGARDLVGGLTRLVAVRKRHGIGGDAVLGALARFHRRALYHQLAVVVVLHHVGQGVRLAGVGHARHARRAVRRLHLTDREGKGARMVEGQLVKVNLALGVVLLGLEHRTVRPHQLEGEVSRL